MNNIKKRLIAASKIIFLYFIIVTGIMVICFKLEHMEHVYIPIGFTAIIFIVILIINFEKSDNSDD